MLETDLERFDNDVDSVLREIGDMLKAKNRAYGDSALNPVRIFSKASTDEQLFVRIDDKLSRVVRGQSAGEDVILDLIGYFIISRVYARRLRSKNFDPT